MATVADRPQQQTPAPAIPKTMQAIVCYAPEDYRLEEVPVPVPGPDEILVKVELCGICMGDIKTYRGAPSFWGDDEQPRYVKPPMIPGHEFVCRVVALGPGAEKRGVAVVPEKALRDLRGLPGDAAVLCYLRSCGRKWVVVAEPDGGAS